VLVFLSSLATRAIIGDIEQAVFDLLKIHHVHPTFVNHEFWNELSGISRLARHAKVVNNHGNKSHKTAL